MPSAQYTPDQAQSSKHECMEIERVIQNYNIIVSRVGIIDPEHKEDKTKRLLNIIFDCYIPKIEGYISSPTENIANEDKTRIENEITKLRAVKPKTDTTPGQESQGRESHESPLVLLLSLALEIGEITASDPRENNKQSGLKNTKGQDWGRLSGFLDYVKELNFKSYTKQEKQSSKYWPGLPYCVMALVPLGDFYQQKSEILLSASPDKFDYLGTQGLQNLLLEKRAKRLAKLESLCNSNEKNQILSARSYSRKIKAWNDKKAELEETKKQSCERLQRTNKELGKELQNQQEKSPALLSRKEAVEVELAKKMSAHAEALEKWENESPLEALDANVPVYLPVIMSTWHPDGMYLATCFLDCLRFRFIRPLGAEKGEQTYKSKKTGNIYPETACAEWDGFINWISQCGSYDKTAQLPGPCQDM